MLSTNITYINKKYGEWALVAGSALGLGEAFCHRLAESGINLIMVDNQHDALNHLSEKVIKRYGIETRLLSLDLAQAEAVPAIMACMEETNCRLMIYNAAFGPVKPFIDCSPDELDKYIHINVRSPLQLVHAFTQLVTRQDKPGGIILMSSLAGLMGMQLIAPYAATKAFAWNLAEALHYELKPKKIDIMACIAGATATDAFLKTNPRYGLFKPQVQQPAEVAKAALANLGKKTLFISGRSNRISYFILMRLLPRKIASRIVNKSMRKMYPDA